MLDWEDIMDRYESNDCESLGEYAADLMTRLMDYFKTFENRQEAADDAVYCALYFVDIDGFVDGGEEDVLRYAFEDWECSINYPMMRKNFHDYGYSRRVESLMRNAPKRILEIFARLGCAVCSGKGYISDQEKRVIMRWAV